MALRRSMTMTDVSHSRLLPRDDWCCGGVLSQQQDKST